MINNYIDNTMTIKVLPGGYVHSEGFPSHFKIEVSDDPEFRTSENYSNYFKKVDLSLTL